jgi:TonB family protein
MATAQMPRRETQSELFPAPPPIEAPAFEQLDSRTTWEHLVALGTISLLVHVLFAVLVIAAVLVMPKNSPIVLTAQQLLNRDDSVYMPITGENSKPIERPKTNIISDRDRRATSKNPTIDRKTLDQLRDNRNPGPPQQSAQQAAQSQVSAQQQAAPQYAAQQPEQGLVPRNGNQVAQLQPPALSGRRAPNFGGPATAGSAIQQAAQAAVANRGSTYNGDYGSGPARARSGQKDALEIVSDTLGVDFGPYMSRMHVVVESNWWNVMPESVYPPFNKKGMVVIEFSILKDGSITGLKILQSSGDVALDRASYASITASNPLAPLPADFKGDYLTIRARYYYNPDRSDSEMR